jgi:MFS family permease
VTVAAVRLRADGDFRRYWAARTVSISGSMVTYVVLPVLVYRMTGSSLWTGLVAAAESLPYLCFGLVAGALADRVDRRRLMVGTDFTSAALLLSVPVAYALGWLTVPHVLLAGFGVHTLFVFFDAANFGALPALVGRARLPEANSTVFGTSTVLELSVPAVAGAVLAVVAPAPLLAADALSFVASGLLIRGIARPLAVVARPAGVRLLGDIREGLAFLVRHPVVRLQTVVGVVVCMAFGTFGGQLVPWADRALGLPPGDWRLGLIFAAWGVGGLVASTLFPPVARALGEIRLTLLVLPVAGALGVGTAFVRHWLVAVVAIAAWAVPSMMVVLNAITLRQKVTPDRLQSRVNTAGRMVGFGLGTPLGAVVGGLTAQAYGPRAAMLLAGALLGAAAVVAWLSPLRTYRRQPAAVAAPAD